MRIPQSSGLNLLQDGKERQYLLKSSVWSAKLSTAFSFLLGRDSSVGIATRYGLDGPEIESR
jgi:hypothetical protein